MLLSFCTSKECLNGGNHYSWVKQDRWTGTVIISNMHRLLKHNALILHLVQWYPILIYFCSLSVQVKGQMSNLTQNQMCEKEAKMACCSLYWKEVQNSDFLFLAVKVMENVPIYWCKVSSINLSQLQMCYKK